MKVHFGFQELFNGKVELTAFDDDKKKNIVFKDVFDSMEEAFDFIEGFGEYMDGVQKIEISGK